MRLVLVVEQPLGNQITREDEKQVNPEAPQPQGNDDPGITDAEVNEAKKRDMEQKNAGDGDAAQRIEPLEHRFGGFPVDGRRG